MPSAITLRDNVPLTWNDNAHFVRVPIAIGSRGVEYIKRLSFYRRSRYRRRRYLFKTLL